MLLSLGSVSLPSGARLVAKVGEAVCGAKRSRPDRLGRKSRAERGLIGLIGLIETFIRVAPAVGCKAADQWFLCNSFCTLSRTPERQRQCAVPELSAAARRGYPGTGRGSAGRGRVVGGKEARAAPRIYHASTFNCALQHSSCLCKSATRFCLDWT